MSIIDFLIFRKRKQIKAKQCRNEIEEFILIVKKQLKIDTEDYREHILLSMLQGYYIKQDEMLAYIAFQKYDNNLKLNFYCKLLKYIKTLDLEILTLKNKQNNLK